MENVVYSFQSKSHQEAYEQKNSFFIRLSRGMSRLEKLGETVVLPKKYIIIDAGEITEYCYVVRNGRVLSFELLGNGEERIYHFYEAGTLFLEDVVLQSGRTAVGFKTACATELIRIHKRELMKQIQKNSQLAFDIIESVSVKYQITLEQIRQTKNQTFSWKICNFFLNLAKYNGTYIGEKVVLKEKLSQQMISDLLGVNRITTVRALQDLKSKGLIEVVDGVYCIKNISELRVYQKEQGELMIPTSRERKEKR